MRTWKMLKAEKGWRHEFPPNPWFSEFVIFLNALHNQMESGLADLRSLTCVKLEEYLKKLLFRSFQRCFFFFFFSNANISCRHSRGFHKIEVETEGNGDQGPGSRPQLQTETLHFYLYLYQSAEFRSFLKYVLKTLHTLTYPPLWSLNEQKGWELPKIT